MAYVRLAGRLAAVSAAFHEIAEGVVLAYAAIGEKETQIAYGRMRNRAEEIGEVEIAEELFRPMIRQESLHLIYYRQAFIERATQWSQWQKQVVGKIIEQVYRSVGVQRSNHERASAFGSVALTLIEEPNDIPT